MCRSRSICSKPAALIIILLALFWGQTASAATAGALAASAKTVSSESVQAILSNLSNEQIRQLLIEELQKDAAATPPSTPLKPVLKGPAVPLARLLNAFDKESVQAEGQLQKMGSGIPLVLPDLHKIFVTLGPDGTSRGAVINFLWIVFAIVIGLVIEKVVKRRVLARYFQIDAGAIRNLGEADRLRASIVNMLPDMIGLCLFFVSASAAFQLFAETSRPAVKLTFLAILITIALIRSIAIVSHIFLSPRVKDFRILPVECQAARTIHRTMLAALSYIISVLMFVIVVHRLGGERQTVLLLQLFFATLLLVLIAIAVLSNKTRVKNHILAPGPGDNEVGWGRKQFASVWHMLAILYLGLLWVLLIVNVVSPEQDTKGAFLLSLIVVPVWMLADRLTQWLVRSIMSTLNIHQEQYDDREEITEEILIAREKGKDLYRKVIGLARASVVFALAIWFASLWNIEIPFISIFAKVLFNAVIIMTLALVFWRFISSWIERKIQESLPEDGGEKKDEDDEWGSAASKGRSYTLLPMVRKFIASILVVMVTMTILSSIGVDIGPLLAGAGVIGLAVGFGAQKLVSDMFSGFFYLLDDAFRVGEYVTAGSVSGTVEAITLRNVMLRHHRGMLQIVPHSELGAITNFMRGGIIVKFNLDFPYDTDIDKVRKIIKKVGATMLEDPEFSKDFIRPLKSQGVREITNSVMSIRAKFTAKPGAHFIIRREAYKRLTEAFAANGIHYAHKRVIVDVPSLSQMDKGAKLTDQQVKDLTEAAGAAALAAINEDEEAAAAAALAAQKGKKG